MDTHCGECPFFKNENTYGYGICDISGTVEHCSLECSFEEYDKLTNSQAVKVLHHAQKWRRGAKIRVLRQKIKED